MINSFHFLEADAYTVPTPEQSLARAVVKFETDNAPFLAGKAPEPDRRIRRLSDEDVQSQRDRAILSEDEAKKVMGDLSATLSEQWCAIVADGTDCEEESRMAGLLGYRPARPGEFIQVLYAIRNDIPLRFGAFFCWQDRQPNYAIFATIRIDGHVIVTFDTHYKDLSDMSANEDTKCIFVKT